MSYIIHNTHIFLLFNEEKNEKCLLITGDVKI